MLRRRDLPEDDIRRAGNAARGCVVGLVFVVVYVAAGLLALLMFGIPAWLLTR